MYVCMEQTKCISSQVGKIPRDFYFFILKEASMQINGLHTTHFLGLLFCFDF